ncbi:hypothetical protein A3742_04755 [Oleiphilus sp. HI0071]|jgi:sec-independent protein translocase protein TatB|uniref:Sec-independent protein translocase protein TatB n=1 Tax=unclassified Oleiphilus TaxID=2631174 RepID=UPI0007C3519C|nr:MULTISPECIES: Sec-independent protein translocase protein TatB [unclassified Oleiphilus]KZY63732.1 hypothetical protein A3737_03335 [Oleiphilus sp. HI0065]KZY86492.1 hypothetical protein A3742_04755 [Oleiphilus sp. HI0071]KZZ06048.1 hypothetical protein A3744_07150 [Oleiphilus sp. HI0073]KZZ51393.1 hypothetical protein A3760_12790 [Oleiphilus sp. HI0122]KZZ51534.1 hypothetical protein A3758_12010 [Oleiphilus sp. HI0118]KZZ75179.1 hypothetical protein A3765_01415 [Oleiphilus sp. HI0130]KZZ
MFDIGFLELIIVAVLALLILGPERLPKAAQTVGRWVGKARRMASTFSQEIDRQLEIETLREQLKEQGKSININDDANKIHETVSHALAEASSSFEPEANKQPKRDKQAEPAEEDTLKKS